MALDLETTGLSSDKDEIIEIGAVKFQGPSVLDTYETFVNPGRPLSSFIKRLTGIAQADVDHAPSFSSVVGALAAFIGRAPIVGHNLPFDLGFLESKGLRLSNPRCDTWDIAFVLFPELQDRSLEGLVGLLSVPHPRPHRALDDALATMAVFLELVERLSRLDSYTLAGMQRLSARSRWSMSYLLASLDAHEMTPRPANDLRSEAEEGTNTGITGVDTHALSSRLRHVRALRPNRTARSLDVELVASLLEEGGPLSEMMVAFERRPEQVAMARAVAEAINRGERLIVEAGTGVGKSLAYLIPAALYSLMNNRRVVVSTNTINLQEQLLNKDVPNLVRALAQVDGIPADEFKCTQLKGRANYLCLKRWNHLVASDSLSESEARLLAKTLVWLQTTATGDRSELNLGHRRSAAPWSRLSAQGATECPGGHGPCFLRAARDRAAAAHLIIVNHALLLSDLTSGGTVIPDYDLLIIDEAHHLEEQATRHLGFEMARPALDEYLQRFSGERGLLNWAVNAFRGSSTAATRQRSVEEVAAETISLIPGVREHVARLFAILNDVVSASGDNGFQGSDELRVTPGIRVQPGWSELEIQWENVDVSLSNLGGLVGRLQLSLEGLEEAGVINYEGLMMELAEAREVGAELRQRLREFIPQPKQDGVYWVARSRDDGDLVLHGAPLHVGETLDKELYSRKDCVVMTSATLSTQGSFAHMRERTGFAESEELLLGSPFDYPRAALLCVPEDMPEPGSRAYQPAVGRAIMDAALAVGGQTMALFTSHASLQGVASDIRGDLQARGITVLAQGVDGAPPQLLRRFLDNRSSVLLGTASFWEGVDLAGESLKVLLLTRLPFNVPSEPVFAARSELYEDPFNLYAVPQAVLRLRQGFGRLIRTKTDRGVVVILDRRIVSRGYGKAFLGSLPHVTTKTCTLSQMPREIQRWIGV